MTTSELIERCLKSSAEFDEQPNQMKNAKPYIPNPIKGQAFPGYIKVSIAQVRRWFESGRTFTGFIVGNRVSSFHFFGGWHLACTLEKNTFAEFQKMLTQWAWYNANPETGNTPAIYLKRPRTLAKRYVLPIASIALPLL